MTDIDVEATRFELFGAQHLWALALVAAAAVLAAALGSRLPESQRRRSGVALGLTILATKLLDFALGVGLWGHRWQDELPLDLCPAAAYLAGICLLRPSYRLWEIVYFWTVAAGANALLTPNLSTGFPSPAFLFYFAGHGLPIAAAFFLITAYGYRATLGSVGRAMLWVVAMAVVVAPLNVLLGTNYMFLLEKPAGLSILDWAGPWPFYLAALFGMAVGSSLLAYLPFPVIATLASRRTGEPR